MLLLRRLGSWISVCAALAPAVLWLWPALAEHRAPSFRDQGDFFYPLKLYTADRIRTGEIPLWNPLSGAGEPWLANAQSGVFYPPGLLFLIRSPALAAALFLLVHFAIAAWGARRFLKEENVSDSGALFGAAAFVAGGYAASLSVYWNHFGAFAYLPGIAAVARGGLRTRASMLGLGVLVGLQAMAGSPEMSFVSIALAIALSLLPRREFPDPIVATPRAVSARRLAAGIGLGLALAAWVLAPMGELALRSDRRHALPAEVRDYGALGATAARSAAGFGGAAGAGGYLESVYAGPLILLAALAAFAEDEPSRRRLAGILGAFALAGLILAMHGPPGSWLRALPPFDRMRYPAKWLAWSVFAAAMLAGLGVDGLRFGGLSGRRRIAAAALFVAGAGVCALSPQPLPVRLASAAGCAALAITALWTPQTKSPAVGALLGGAAAAALVVALALASLPLPRFAPEEALRRCPTVIEPLSHVPGRVVTPPMETLWGWVLRDDRFDEALLRRQREALLGYTNLTCRVPTLRTAAPLKTAGAAAIEESVGPAEDPLPASAAGARVLWTPVPPARLPSRHMEEFYRAPLAPYRPRLSFLSGYRVEPDAARAWQRVAAGEIDLTREVLLDRRPEPDPRGASASAKPMLVARLAEDAPERVVAELTTANPGILVMTDLHYPGWIAEEDGRRLPILRADGFFRAVALKEGTHRVVFRYRPLAFYAGAAVSVLTLLTMLVLWNAGEPVRAPRRSR
ncbi:MAG TPA: hypothetical protein VGH97_06765 [Thermoanaerobaculia bacterium]